MQRQPPMTPRQRFFLAVTVLSFLTVTGFVIGCDSDDGPTVTAPNGGNGGTTPTRNMTAEQQGREGLEETAGGRAIRNTGEVALNVRFNYNGAASGSGSGAGIRSTHTTARHYRLDRGATMPSDPAQTGTAPTRFACGVPATARANGQCFDNDRSEIQSAPTSYTSAAPPFDLSFEGFGFPGQKASSCVVQETAGDGKQSLRNTCGTDVYVLMTGHNGGPGLQLEPFKDIRGFSMYDSLQNFRQGRTAREILKEWVEEPRTADAEEYERRAGVAASAFSYYSHITTHIPAGQILHPHESYPLGPPYHACYVREESMVNRGGWAYFPGAKTSDINGEWSRFIGHTSRTTFADRMCQLAGRPSPCWK